MNKIYKFNKWKKFIKVSNKLNKNTPPLFQIYNNIKIIFQKL